MKKLRQCDETTERNTNTLPMVETMSHHFLPGILKLLCAKIFLDKPLILFSMDYALTCLCTVAQWAH